MTIAEEKELIEKIRAGDREAIDGFFVHFHERIFLLVKKKLGPKPGDAGDCQDLAAQILWEAIVSIQNGNYNEKKGRVGQYLYGILSNTFKNYFKLIKKESPDKF